MGNNGMNPKATGQTNPGGDNMEVREITLGQVTYEVRRVFAGTRPAAELLAEHIAKRLEENPPFDEKGRDAV